MTVSKGPFLSILAMDVYNRTYDEGVERPGGLGSCIGSATIRRESNIAEESDGVTALTYSTQYCQVISYGGTNDLSLNVRTTGWVFGALPAHQPPSPSWGGAGGGGHRRR
jgi:hypothetical protein